MQRRVHYSDNLSKYSFDGCGKYGIPAILGGQNPPDVARWADFREAIRANPANLGVHFFLDDYRFSAVWTYPDRYIDRLKSCAAVLSPDFSLYTDMPLAMQIWNHYRKQWVSAYWQKCGVNVIPTVGWSDARSFDFCFDGVPKHSVVAVSSVGTQKNKSAKVAFEAGYNKMLEVLQPVGIIYHGKPHADGLSGIIRIESIFTDKFKKGEDD